MNRIKGVTVRAGFFMLYILGIVNGNPEVNNSKYQKKQNIELIRAEKRRKTVRFQIEPERREQQH